MDRMDDVNSLPIEEVPVLIIGASMVGLTLSALLAAHNVPTIAVEKHASTAIRPRAALLHPRTMQIYDDLGLYDAMVAESAKHYDVHAGVVSVESLAGKFLGTMMEGMNDGADGLSPTRRLFLTQQMFEPILREKASKDGADLRFGNEMVGFEVEKDKKSVLVLMREVDSGKRYFIRAQYMVACDGSRSPVRKLLGIQMKGYGFLSHSLTIYLDIDVGKYVKGKYNGVIYVNNPAVRGFFRLDKEGRKGFLAVNTAGQQGTEESRHIADDITHEKARELVRAAVGEDVEFNITEIAKWQAGCDIADRFTDDTGRVLLAGDAAHIVTPNGGFGGNTGIQDAQNLAWKLALVLRGQASHTLVHQTYEQERWPVVQKTIDQVLSRYVARTAPELQDEFEKKDIVVESVVPSPHLELGYRYHSAAVDTSELSEVLEDPAKTPSKPGSLARHVNVVLAGEHQACPVRSLIQNSFCLILTSQAEDWAEATKTLIDGKDHNLPVIRVCQLSEDSDSEFCARYAITNTGAVLIRPDAVVAWSASDSNYAGRHVLDGSSRTIVLEKLMDKLLCRQKVKEKL